jgi:hypothetical protein
MPKYIVTYKIKIETSKRGEITDYKLVDKRMKVNASSFKEARNKIRKTSGYEISDIKISEVSATNVLNRKMVLGALFSTVLLAQGIRLSVECMKVGNVLMMSIFLFMSFIFVAALAYCLQNLKGRKQI